MVLMTLARSSTVNLVFEILLEECGITSSIEAGPLSASVVINTLTIGGSIMVATSSVEGAAMKVVSVTVVLAAAISTLFSLPLTTGSLVLLLSSDAVLFRVSRY